MWAAGDGAKGPRRSLRGHSGSIAVSGEVPIEISGCLNGRFTCRWHVERMHGDAPEDPFFQQMFSRMTPGARGLFTPAQLDEIKRAFGARAWGSHAIDIRFTFPLLLRSYYVVFLLGPERRSSHRGIVSILGRALSRILEVAVLASGAGVAMLIAAYGLYVIKWALGIDIFPNWGLHITPPRLWRELIGG
jgi:hypothetical protein